MMAACCMQAVNGYKITLKSNLNNHRVYLWYSYGDAKYPLDTSMTNAEGMATFQKPYELTGGVFILYLTPRKALEFLLTDENDFTIHIDTADVSGKTTFTGSRENTLYYEFLRKINFNQLQQELIKGKAKKPGLAPDSAQLLREMYDAYGKQEELIKKQLLQKHKGTFLANLVAAGMKPDVSRSKGLPYWQQETKRRFFENVNFSDERLAFSPVLFNLYEEYIQDWIYKDGDSLIKACDKILAKAGAGKENFKWSLYFLSSSFERSSVQGQDKVFVHLVEEYYKKGKCWWLSKEQLDNMFRRADILKKLFVGSLCPDFTAQDSSGKDISLHSRISKTTVLYFWSYDCKHCLEESPRLAAWLKKNPKINLVTACASPDEEKWKEKLQEFGLPGTHLIDPELKANYNYTYSIISTPTIFVLDKNKKIIGKYIDDTKGLEEFVRKNRLN
jgi:peroxiredoxin